jgi:cytochrome c5
MEGKIAMNLKYVLVAGVALTFVSAFGLVAQQGGTKPIQPAANGVVRKQQAAQPHSEGERVFQQNCYRCHNAPEGFSPRIAGTIVRHMRVRASLSPHDEQVLLKYFNQ